MRHLVRQQQKQRQRNKIANHSAQLYRESHERDVETGQEKEEVNRRPGRPEQGTGDTGSLACESQVFLRARLHLQENSRPELQLAE